MADTDRELALMTVHRDRLEAFMKSKDLKVEQLARANLRRRIDMDLLTIELSPPSHYIDQAQTPVKDAMQSFGGRFEEDVAHVITFIAVLIPWLVIILPGLILLRWFWHWIGRWLARLGQAPTLDSGTAK